ncbi:MAG: glycoside hydrolase family 18 protein [Treponema sp.]|jgi:chitinase|nr:glycoside hydrolase family 18 protein [Treponema sp.]
MTEKKEIFLKSAVILFCMLIAASCATSGGGEMVPKVSSYIRTWPIPPEVREGDDPYWNAGMIKGEYLTDLIVAFALIDSGDGSSIYIPELRELADGTPMFSNIWDEIAAVKEKYPHIKVNISVGGYNAEGFSDMADDPALKAAFIANVVTWLRDYNLDGVDIDWEYPVGPEWGQEIKSRPADRTNYVSLLRDIRKALDDLGAETGKRYGLSTAVPASNWFPAVNDVVEVAKIVDGMKLMAYDYYGGWNGTTGHHSNLSNNPDDPAWGGWSTRQAVDAYIDAWVPPEKIMLGFGFYGHAWKGVEDGESRGLYQPYKELPFDQGTVSYTRIKEMLEPGSGFTRYWDPIAEAPFLYNGDIWVSYTDEEAIRLLAAYARERKLGGVFIWEYVHDIDADLLQVLAENVQ